MYHIQLPLLTWTLFCPVKRVWLAGLLILSVVLFPIVGLSGILCLGISLRFAYSSLQSKLKVRKKSVASQILTILKENDKKGERMNTSSLVPPHLVVIKLSPMLISIIKF